MSAWMTAVAQADTTRRTGVLVTGFLRLGNPAGAGAAADVSTPVFGAVGVRNPTRRRPAGAGNDPLKALSRLPCRGSGRIWERMSKGIFARPWAAAALLAGFTTSLAHADPGAHQPGA